MTKAKRKARLCYGKMMWHDDGNAFMCDRCGHVVQRTRDNPMPDTTHVPKRTLAAKGSGNGG